MFDIYDLLLGGLAPMIAAAAAFGAGWAATRRAGVAWSAGLLVGYAAGVAALDARGAGFAAGLRVLVQPAEAKHWTPLAGLLASLPMITAYLARRRWPQWALAAPLCAAAPLWLLWGSSYLPSAEVRASGFASNAWGPGQATLIIAGVAAALLAAWYCWEAVDREAAPRVRSLLAVISLVAAAATAGLTGSFVYAQLFGVLAASLGGCTAMSWLVGVKSGPEAAAGPAILLTGCLLFLAATLSELPAIHAAALAVAIVVSAGWLPGVNRLGGSAQMAIRSAVCLIPLAIVLWQAGAAFVETQRQQQEEAASNPYLNL